MSKLKDVYAIKDYFEGPLKAYLEKYFKDVRIFSSITWFDDDASAVHVRTSIAPNGVPNPVQVVFEQNFSKTGFGYISNSVDISYSGVYEKRKIRKVTDDNDLAEQYVRLSTPLIQTCYKIDIEHLTGGYKMKTNLGKAHGADQEFVDQTVQREMDRLKFVARFIKLAPKQNIKESISNILKEEEEEKSLYVCRKLKNADELIEWAKAQGFKKTLPADDMHVTIVYSKKKMNWFSVPDGFDSYQNEYDDDRSVEALGEAVVLKFTSTDLSARWKEFRDAGASWDYPSYMPHVSITYDPGDVDLDNIEPYTGLLEFGPEEFTEVESGWADDIEEVSESYVDDEDDDDDDYQGDYDSPEDEKWIRASVGYWITSQGDILPCVYDTDSMWDNMHHNNVANKHLNREDDDGMEIAFETGWVRVRINDGVFYIEYYSNRVTPKAYRMLLKKIDEFDGAFQLEDYKGGQTYIDKRFLKVAMSRLNNMSESIIPRSPNVQRK